MRDIDDKSFVTFQLDRHRFVPSTAMTNIPLMVERAVERNGNKPTGIAVHPEIQATMQRAANRDPTLWRYGVLTVANLPVHMSPALPLEVLAVMSSRGAVLFSLLDGKMLDPPG